MQAPATGTALMWCWTSLGIGSDDQMTPTNDAYPVDEIAFPLASSQGVSANHMFAMHGTIVH